MNIENINKLITHLEQLPDQNFHWNILFKEDDCDMIACCAGWCNVLMGIKNIEMSFPEEIFIDAKNWLGLNHIQSKLLFIPYYPGQHIQDRHLDLSYKLIKEDMAILNEAFGLKEKKFSFPYIDENYFYKNPKLVAKLIRLYRDKWIQEEKEYLESKKNDTNF